MHQQQDTCRKCTVMDQRGLLLEAVGPGISGTQRQHVTK